MNICGYTEILVFRCKCGKLHEHSTVGNHTCQCGYRYNIHAGIGGQLYIGKGYHRLTFEQKIFGAQA